VVASRFGTDGVRGVANVELTPELVLALGRAVARTISAPTFLVGRDTRRSGPMLLAALAAGLASEGADVVDVGVLPTPALAWLSASRDVPAAVISASHNPFADNGIKLFAAGGAKLSAEMESAIEDELERILDPSVKGPRSLEGHGVGTLTAQLDQGDAYVEHLGSLIEGRRLDGLRLVVDSANGAASGLAARVYEQLGAEVVAIGCDPDGTNINDGCGSTSTDTLSSAVVEHQADLGLALDGDADRLLAVDGTGALADGDELLALFALDLADRGQLAGNTVVVTVMTNLGFRMAMEERGIA
jgi:phosphoglucosamine mutase